MGTIAITTGSNWDWNMIGPDLVVAATTGVFVGVVLLLAQGFTQSRNARVDSRFAWESLKPKVSGAIHRPWPMDLNDLRLVPPALSALDDIVSSEPLSLWKRHLKRPDRALDLVLDLSRSRAAYESVAVQLELAWKSFEMQSATTSADQFHVGRILRARAYGRPESDVTPDIDPYNQFDLAKLSTLVDELVAHRPMALALARFHSVVRKYSDSLVLLTLLLEFGEAFDEPARVN